MTAFCLGRGSGGRQAECRGCGVWRGGRRTLLGAGFVVLGEREERGGQCLATTQRLKRRTQDTMQRLDQGRILANIPRCPRSNSAPKLRVIFGKQLRSRASKLKCSASLRLLGSVRPRQRRACQARTPARYNVRSHPKKESARVLSRMRSRKRRTARSALFTKRVRRGRPKEERHLFWERNVFRRR